jgi:tRNA pseudouridine65 synthase
LLGLLYRDDEAVVVAKPSGLVTHRGFDKDEEAALQAARDLVGAHVFPVHRLDRGASGALMFARSPEAAARLHGLFERGAVDKRYLAIVRGAPPPAGDIDHPIPRREDGPRVPARTLYRTLAIAEVDMHGRRQAYALVEASPATGRLHQVRRHLKHIGHPLLGDVNYGRSEHNRFVRDRFGLARLALHAASLAWPLEDGTLVRADAPVPKDLCAVLTAMGLWRD